MVGRYTSKQMEELILNDKKYTVEEASDRLRRSEVTIRRDIKDGRIKAIRMGRRWLIDAGEIARLLSEGIGCRGAAR